MCVCLAVHHLEKMFIQPYTNQPTTPYIQTATHLHFLFLIIQALTTCADYHLESLTFPPTSPAHVFTPFPICNSKKKILMKIKMKLRFSNNATYNLDAQPLIIINRLNTFNIKISENYLIFLHIYFHI